MDGWDSWNANLFDELENRILKNKFLLSNLCYTHYYFHDDDNYEGGIVSTSIRIYSNDNEWIKRVVTDYIDANMIKKEISYEREIDKTVIENIEKNTDLRKLNNNYANELLINDEERYELVYNNSYKIIGTYDIAVKDIDYIRSILMVSDILEDEQKKVCDLL